MHHFEYKLRIYWEDTDAGGIVFYANYLKFFERGRTEWLRSLGIHQQSMREQDSVQLVVSEAYTRYLCPARLDDEIIITTHIKTMGKASVTVTQKAYLQSTSGELLCEGEIKIGCVSANNLKPCRFPTQLATALLTA